jgi:SAM-dependent methyltransferase
MKPKLELAYQRDREVWNRCAATYEERIVGGHPDIAAFEAFEEDFLDRALRHLAGSQERPIKLLDLGCGSGRLHLRYGAKTTRLSELPEDCPLRAVKTDHPWLAFDPMIANRVREVWGIDFSRNMIDLAGEKIAGLGFDSAAHVRLSFDCGSAFTLEPEPDDDLPVAVCLVNSIGVMQGPAGAESLFRSMRRAVERAGGIALISAFRREAIRTFALGQYESTLDVSGQPGWLEPDTYAGGKYTQVAHYYKVAHSPDPTLAVDVFDSEGNRVKQGHLLERNEDAVARTAATGEIRTHSDYQSHWYGFDQFNGWMQVCWDGLPTRHLQSKDLDALRAEPAQMAILDPCGRLDGLLERWGIELERPS